MFIQSDWRDITYLTRGSSRQSKAYAVLGALEVFEILRADDPVLVGTIPIAVDIETSDLDISCAVYDPAAFEREVTAAFGSCEGFRVERKTVEGVPRVVADFFYAGFPIQVFGQPRG
jgi:hypothetical protein